ncbi:MAG: hypothetical protein L0Y76_12025, partial [Ignavibacteria bacterium]|nr:hypothetical protein [Ignavibacteria bacterium]
YSFRSYFISELPSGSYNILFSDTNNIGYRSVIENDTLTVISSAGNFRTIYQNNLIYDRLLPVQPKSNCFWIAADNGNIYLSDVGNLYVIDKTNFNFRVKMKYKYNSLKNIFYHSGKLYGINSLASIYDNCGGLVCGIKIISLKER